MNRILAVLGLVLLFASCSDDDDADGGDVFTLSSLSEVEPVNRAEIQAFLKTHFYNYEEFQNPPADFDFKILIDTIAGDNSDRIPLIQQVDSAIINVNSADFTTLFIPTEEVNVPHQYYYLSARDGEGPSPTFADSTLVRFEGKLLNLELFDASTDFIWFELPDTFRGFANGIANFRAGTPEGLTVNPDGTVSFSNSGIGLIVMPSGLAAFVSNAEEYLLMPVWLFKLKLVT